MSDSFAPKGRRGIPDQLRNFGRHLVYSEGTKTEPFYVSNIKECIAKRYQVNPNSIELVCANGKSSLNTIGLARFAMSDVNVRIKNGESIDHVWIFYDKDSFPKDHYKNAFTMIEGLNKYVNDEGVKVDDKGIAWHSLPSNECFELFLLLYFNYVTSSLNRAQYTTMIENSVHKVDPLFTYAKNLKGIHNIILNAGGSVKNAIRFGKRLEKQNKLENPSSKAYIFLEYFNRYLA